MRKQTKIILLLLILSPAMGELLSGSSPPLEFFFPLSLLLMILLYGCGTLLIREARTRWGLQWSILFLAIAYGIIEEGLMVKSFFNPGWEDLDKLSEYGEFLGVQWVWTIMLIAYHATISTLIPIAIADRIWPDYKNSPLLGKRGLRLSFAGLALVTIFGMAFIGTSDDGEMTPYYPNPLLMVATFVIVVMLIWLSYAFKRSKVSMNWTWLLPPTAFGIAGFLFQTTNLLVPSALAENNIEGWITVAVQMVEMTLAMFLGISQIYHQRTTERHIVYLICGTVLFWILLTPIQEFANGARGMLAVGIITFALLILWSRSALHIQPADEVIQ